MASLATIYGQMTEQDIEKQAEVAEATGIAPPVDEETLEKAAHYDEIGRGLAHQVFAQVLEDPELAKEAMGHMPPAFLAAVKAKSEGKGDDKDDDKDDDKGEGEGEGDDKDKKKAKAKDVDKDKGDDYDAKMSEKKAAVMESMYQDEEYLAYICDKYLVAPE